MKIAVLKLVAADEITQGNPLSHRDVLCPMVTSRLYYIIFLREPKVGIDKEIKVTEKSRNQETHGEKTVRRSHESAETKKLSSTRRTLEEARKV